MAFVVGVFAPSDDGLLRADQVGELSLCEAARRAELVDPIAERIRLRPPRLMAEFGEPLQPDDTLRERAGRRPA